MIPPLSPFSTVLATLTQGMSAGGSTVTNELSWQLDAQHATADRLVWLPKSVGSQEQKYQLSAAWVQTDQAVTFDVAIYGSSFDRALELHRLLYAWIDIIYGPWMGNAPSDDETPASLTGTVDLNALAYPYDGLAGMQLNFTAPAARALAMPAVPVADPASLVGAIRTAANALGLGTQVYLVSSGANAYLRLEQPTNPLLGTGAALTLDPTASGSACAILGFSSGADNITSTGTPPTRPYRPGYRIGESKQPQGGNAASGLSWGMLVPVRLFVPITSIQYLFGTIQTTPVRVIATGGDTPDETVVDIESRAS